MGLIVATHRLGEGPKSTSTLSKICCTDPTVIKHDAVIPYLKNPYLSKKY